MGNRKHLLHHAQAQGKAEVEPESGKVGSGAAVPPGVPIQEPAPLDEEGEAALEEDLGHS